MTAAELKYLMAIDALNHQDGITLTAVAQKMNVSKVSVYHAVERLARSGYITRDDKGHIIMSPHGSCALQEYRASVDWLACHLEFHCKISHEHAVQDAIGAICAMSDESRQGIHAYITQPKADCKHQEEIKL